MDQRLLDFLIGRGRYSPFNPEPLIVAGLTVAIVTILFVHRNASGCFYAGASALEGGCKGPISYYGALGTAALLLLAGLYRSFAAKTSANSDRG